MADRSGDTTGKKLLSFVAKRSKRVQEKVRRVWGVVTAVLLLCSNAYSRVKW